MMKIRPGIIMILSAVFVLYTCIDPYTPNLSGYASLLVVDGLITNSDNSNIVRLSRTFQQVNTGVAMVPDATVYLTDDLGNSNYLINMGNGIYKTDSLQFKGNPGRTYVLHVLTGDGDEYESDPCLMQPVAEIDSIYFGKDQELLSNGTQTEDGIMIYLDSKAGTNQYYRWSYEENWKYKVPYPRKFNYIRTKDFPDAPTFSQVKDAKEFCWKNSQSSEILVRSISDGQMGKIMKQPVSFIATGQTDRLLLQYSILVKQYSISKREYDFWENLKQVNEIGGDIFAKQPYTVISNIHSAKNTKERVLGFFQVSAVSQKRKFILYSDIALMSLPSYSYPCKTWEFKPLDFQTADTWEPPKTWDDVMWYLTIANDYVFIQPLFSGVAQSSGGLAELVFTRPECATCDTSGDSEKPSFWVDLK
jgi:hypothetical protein